MAVATDIEPNLRYAEALIERFSNNMEMSFRNAIRFLAKRQNRRAAFDLLGFVSEGGFARYPSDSELVGLKQLFAQYGYQLPPIMPIYSNGSVARYVQY